LNLSNTLFNLGKKILVISLKDSKNESLNNYKFANELIEIQNSGRLLNRWIDFTKKIIPLIKQHQSSYIIASDLYSLPGAAISKNSSILIYDSREIYSALASLNKRILSQFIISRIEKLFLTKVNKIIVSGELDKFYLQHKLTDKLPYTIIKNLPPFREIQKNNFIREKYHLDNDSIVLIYQGVVLNGRGLIPILKALSKLENTYLFIIGENFIKDKIISEAKSHKILNKVLLMDAVDYENLHPITCSADIGLALFEPVGDSYKLALPNKLFEYCMAGIPVLASNLVAINGVIADYGIGALVNDVYNIDEISEKILFLNNKSNKEEIIKNIMKAKNELSYQSQENIIRELIN